MPEKVEVTDWSEERIKEQVAEWEGTSSDKIVECYHTGYACAARIKMVNKELLESVCVNLEFVEMKDYETGSIWLFQLTSGIVNLDGAELTMYGVLED